MHLNMLYMPFLICLVYVQSKEYSPVTISEIFMRPLRVEGSLVDKTSTYFYFNVSLG